MIMASMAFIHEGIDGTNQCNPLKTVVLQTELNMLTQFCNMYDALLPTYQRADEYEAFQLVDYDNDSLECIFVQVRKSKRKSKSQTKSKKEKQRKNELILCIPSFLFVGDCVCVCVFFLLVVRVHIIGRLFDRT